MPARSITVGRDTPTDPVPRREVARAPRTRITARAAILLVVVFLLLLFAASPFRAYLAQRSKIAELERETSVLEKANAELHGRIAKLHDPDELARLASECLGMVQPGQVAFVIVPEGGGSPPTDC